MLKFSWRGRLLHPSRIERALVEHLRALRDLLQGAASAAKDSRFADLVDRIDAAAEVLRGAPPLPRAGDDD